MYSRKEEKKTVETPRAAPIPNTIDDCSGSDKVFTPDGEGSTQPSGPIPAMATGSGSGAAFLLKKERDEEFMFGLVDVTRDLCCCCGVNAETEDNNVMNIISDNFMLKMIFFVT